MIWPDLIHHPGVWFLPTGIVHALLAALSLLSILGLRYPLQMLPLLLFELVWKTIWLTAIALPLWWADRMDAGAQETAIECLMAVIFIVVIPWRYVFETYVARRGDRWA